GEPSPLARELSHRYREIMVDEYQDVNAVQDMIFRALSRDGKNLFMVGDVKQSIYRFRLADPTIFLDKYESYADYGYAEGDEEPLRILLQENFRSRRSILDASNQVFSNIMSVKLGELDYDDAAALRYGSAVYPEGSDTPVELCLIDPGLSEISEESPEKAALEARFIAKRIKDMMAAGTPVHEKDSVRPCRWSDFVLLMRSPGGKGSIFHAELSRAGIPVQSRQAGGFFSSLEVGIAMDMLTVIDNPHADVSLISVLRSPAFGFSADELSAIRAADKGADFYSALLRCAEKGNERCAAFAQRLAAIRKAAPDLSLDELLWRIYTETELFALCSAMSGGDERRANLMTLFQMARSFEESGYRGLFRFVAWLRRMAENDREPPRSGDGDHVSIMSIHKSKGLEFPFVFLCDLGHGFNRQDEHAQVLLHSRLGLGPKVTDSERGIEYPSLAHRAIAKQIDRETLSEEMRVLYVAMTRAKEQLIMSSIYDNSENRLAKLRDNAASPMPPVLLRSCSAPVQWLIYAAMTDDEGLIDMKVVSPPQPDDEEQSSESERESAICDAALLEALRERLNYIYPYRAATELPTKVSATALKDYEDEAAEEAAALVREVPEFEFRRPRFGDEKAHTLSAAAFGTATHSFLQYVDLEKTSTLEELEGELSRLKDAALLSEEEAKAIKCPLLLDFFRSSTGALLRRGKVHREFRFTLLSDASECFGEEVEGEEILLQGIIDCLVEEGDSLSIIDYKTDRISAAEVPERAKRYQSQLWAYARSS
ncbi:MAG: UvrD-helicase domain-containing protein, partial [Oscillospiraceae bacterium]|nr:UvrD-helicase domain-containing protein [Oscillospiraceae bacterium]